MLVKKTIYTKRWERHDLDEAWGDHSMAWWQEGTEGKITKYIALGLNIKALIKRRNPKRRDSGLTYGKWCVCCRASTWCSTESPLATQPWPRLSGTQLPSLPRWSSTGRFRRWCEIVHPHNIINIIIYQAGMVLPFSQDIYKPILTRLKAEGISAIEKSTFLS